MADFDGRVVLVTGAASGIGLATAQRFAREGAAIAGLDVQKPGDDDWRGISELSPDSIFVLGDVSDEAAVEAWVSEACRKLGGRIDVLVNAAGIAVVCSTEDLSQEDWSRVIDVNLKGCFLTSKHVGRVMLAQGGGSIVHVASIEGMEGFGMQMVYGSSKAGLIQMTRNTAVDFSRGGIRVNCVCPGVIETPMTAVLQEEESKTLRDQMLAQHLLDRFGQPEEVAAAIRFLASDEASFITGEALVVDGGFIAGRRYDF